MPRLSEKTLQQVHQDLTLRARGGIFIYIIIWMMFSYWANIPQNTPTAFWINTTLLVFVLILKSIHYWVHVKNPSYNVRVMYRILVTLVLISAIHWGGLSAWLLYFSPYEQLFYPTIIAMAAFAMGGTATLSIAISIRTIYPLIIYCPSIFISFVSGDDSFEALMLSTMAMLSTMYILIASAASSKDYYTAIKNHRLAEHRAAELHTLSITDTLTGLKNRMHFNQCFIEEWKRCSRSQLSLCFMMIDLDKFKQINDQYGHSNGDLTLQCVARILLENFPRDTDTVARYGGEEFVVLMPDTGIDEARKIAQKTLESFRQTPMHFNDHSFSITCSIGIACTIPHYHNNHESLMIAADQAMYNAKDNGRNQYCIEAIKKSDAG